MNNPLLYPASKCGMLIRAIRSLPNDGGGHVRAIAVSAYARREDRERALKSGFNDHVAKPVQPDDLYDAIDRLSVHNNTPPMKNKNEPGAKVH